MALERELTSPAEFDAWVLLPEQSGRHFEYVRGELIEKMVTKHRHSAVTMRLCSRITVYLDNHDLPGYTTGETGGYAFGPERYIPDCAYVPQGQPGDQVYSTVAPKLVIEVISDPANEYEMRTLRNKRETYLKAGTTVWEVYPDDALVDVYSADGRYSTERERLTFDGLPGLEIPLDRIFA